MGFKTWLAWQENLAGPGGGPDHAPTDLVGLNKDIASKGAGAFPTIGNDPPRPVRTATRGYEDPRFNRKACRKHLRKA